MAKKMMHKYTSVDGKSGGWDGSIGEEVTGPFGAAAVTDADVMAVGRHCTAPHCRQLDFLPFTCTGCHKDFCLEHRTYKAHQCPAAPKDKAAETCTRCHQVVVGPSQMLPSTSMAQHVASGCTAHVSRRLKTKCSMPGCRCKDYLPFTCTSCCHTYCVRHRLAIDHRCTPLISAH